MAKGLRHRRLTIAALILGLCISVYMHNAVSQTQDEQRAKDVTTLPIASNWHSSNSTVYNTRMHSTFASTTGFDCDESSSNTLDFDPTLCRNYIANASVVVFLGNKPSFGRFNNQIIAILHALDFIYDRYGEIETPANQTAIVVVSKWVEQLFQTVIGDDWEQIIAKYAPIVTGKPSELRRWKNYQKPYTFSSKKIYYYRMRNHVKTSLEIIMQRRRRLFGALFGQRHCTLHKRVVQHLGTSDYVAVHIRSLEGGCSFVLPDRQHERECRMSPEYIREILVASNATNLPLVIVSDMQNTTIVKNIQSAFAVESVVVLVPAWDFVDTNYTVQDDMMLAARSSVFVGTRVSTMSIVVAQLRVCLYGKDPFSNYVFVYPNSTTVCPHCAFQCSKQEQKDGLCGLNHIIA
jgi:hypothetical protein